MHACMHVCIYLGMSCQCWCYTCYGRLVCRNTFIEHGRKDRPDPPTRKRPLEMLSMQSQSNEMDDLFLNDDEVLIDQEEEPDPWGNLLEGLEGEIGEGKLSVGQVTLLLVDWMSTHKVTDAATKAIWNIINAMSPKSVEFPGFYAIKERLRNHEVDAVRRIDICPNDCIAYYNTEHLVGDHAQKHAHRSKCPLCNTPRYVKDPKSQKTIPVKTIYHFPLKNYVQSLYNRPDLSKYLWHDCGERPEGHVARSRGFKEKVLDNPVMNKDNRNLALIGATDGVPFFDDQIRGCWPFIFRYYKHLHVLSFLYIFYHL